MSDRNPGKPQVFSDWCSEPKIQKVDTYTALAFDLTKSRPQTGRTHNGVTEAAWKSRISTIPMAIEPIPHTA